MRLTLGDIRNNTRVPQKIGVCPSDSRIPSYVNSAQQMLIPRGKWWGTYGKFRMCASNGCITLPSCMATIESAAVCHRPVSVRDQWFEFMENGAGTGNECSMWNEARSLGRFATFSDINGTDKSIKLVCDVAADVGALVTVTGWDQNGNWVRTQQNGVWTDGQVFALAQGAGVISITGWTRIKDLLFPSQYMNGQSWLYEHNATANTDRLIGHYQYNDTRPSFARYFFSGVYYATQDPTICACSQNGEVTPQSNVKCTAGTQTTVEVMAKLDVVPVVKDTDYLILTCIPAIEAMVEGLVNAEKESDHFKRIQIRGAARADAVSFLNEELDHYLGSGRKIGIQMVGSSVGELDPVCNFV